MDMETTRATSRTVRDVIVLNDFAHVQGGASAVALREATLLAGRSALRIHLLAACGPISPGLVEARVDVRCLGQGQLLDASPAAAVNGIWNRAAVGAARALLSRLNPATTVVHLHGWTKALSVGPAMIAVRNGFPVVTTLHDFFTACPNGAFFDFGGGTICTRTPLAPSCIVARCDKRSAKHKLFRLGRSAAWRGLGFPRALTEFISASEQTIELLRPYLPPGAAFHRLGFSTDTGSADRVAIADNELLVFIGRLEEEKGVGMLAAAAAAEGRKVLFIGDGPLRKSVEAHGTSTVTGWLEEAAIPPLLDRARCLVFPSLWYETYGLVVDQAASRGVPAIVGRTTAAAERIEQGRTGWLFDTRDPGSLRAAIRTAFSTPNLDAIGRATQAHYADRTLKPDALVRALIAIYDGVVERHAPPPASALRSRPSDPPFRSSSNAGRAASILERQ